MNNELNRKIEGLASKVNDQQPPYTTGVLVRTTDVLFGASRNPWFMALNNMSGLEAAAMIRDAEGSSGGWSVVVSDKTNKEGFNTFINPLQTDGGLYGSASGKAYGSNVYGGDLTIAHMNSNRKETPTVMALHTLASHGGLNTNTLFGSATASRNRFLLPGQTTVFQGGQVTGAMDQNNDGKLDYRDLAKFAVDRGFFVSSTTGGKHNTGSLHYEGLAVDVSGTRRTGPDGQTVYQASTDEQFEQLLKEARAAGFRAVDERTRPPGQKVWGGRHIHLEIPRAVKATWRAEREGDRPIDARTQVAKTDGTGWQPYISALNAMGKRSTTGTRMISPSEVQQRAKSGRR